MGGAVDAQWAFQHTRLVGPSFWQLEPLAELHQVGPGELVIVPAGVPHGFKNTGEGVLKQIDIHVSPSFSTEWLD